MFNASRNTRLALVLLVCGVTCSARATACDIPVFRYALERWTAEEYQVVVFHRGALDPSHVEVIGALKQAASENGGEANFTVRVADLDGIVDEAAQALWRPRESNELPRIVVAYPAVERVQERVWSGPLSQATVNNISTSPVREEIARRLQDGESGVWLLLESGDTDKDTAAAKLLEAELAKMPEQLTLPDFSLEPQWTGFSSDLKIAFSLVRLSRTDPAEELFRAMLLRSEEDLEKQHASSQPIAFLIFGRGRTLYALVGRGINKQNIEEACEFVVGPCACDIKAENPGLDLLVGTSWDSALGTPLVRDIVLPPLTSISAQATESEKEIETTAQAAAPQPAPEQPVASTPDETRSHRLLLSILIALGSIVVAVAVFAAIARKHSSVT